MIRPCWNLISRLVSYGFGCQNEYGVLPTIFLFMHSLSFGNEIRKHRKCGRWHERGRRRTGSDSDTVSNQMPHILLAVVLRNSFICGRKHDLHTTYFIGGKNSVAPRAVGRHRNRVRSLSNESVHRKRKAEKIHSTYIHTYSKRPKSALYGGRPIPFAFKLPNKIFFLWPHK